MLLDPDASEWSQLRGETLTLAPTPAESQPSQYVVNAWNERPYGQTGMLSVEAAHNGDELFFRLGWPDGTRDDRISDTDRFSDAAAVLLPIKGDAPLQAMGSAEEPVNAWFWRADQEDPISVTATGLGTTVREGNGSLSAAAAYSDEGWRVVLSRPMVLRGAFALRPGFTKKVAFAVWQGSNQERAGIKAVTPEWQELEIEE